jgi:hypothetical protein
MTHNSRIYLQTRAEGHRILSIVASPTGTIPGRLIWVIQHLLDIHLPMIFNIFYVHPSMFRSYSKLTLLYTSLFSSILHSRTGKPEPAQRILLFLSFYPLELALRTDLLIRPHPPFATPRRHHPLPARQ